MRLDFFKGALDNRPATLSSAASLSRSSPAIHPLIEKNMPEVSGRTLVVAIKAVQREIESLAAYIESGDEEGLADTQELLMGVEEAATELKTAYAACTPHEQQSACLRTLGAQAELISRSTARAASMSAKPGSVRRR